MSEPEEIHFADMGCAACGRPEDSHVMCTRFRLRLVEYLDGVVGYVREKVMHDGKYVEWHSHPLVPGVEKTACKECPVERRCVAFIPRPQAKTVGGKSPK